MARESSPSRPAIIARTCSAESAKRRRERCFAPFSPSAASASAAIGDEANLNPPVGRALGLGVVGIVERRCLAIALGCDSRLGDAVAPEVGRDGGRALL